ncbi:MULTISPECIES: prephenate dehydrogenase [Streptomyces]|uniref:Prephenate dehydrogenase/arogenate dehydrogenase family protein n=1 Tax=Streptomyces parvus TaxID=66428 RepID=A0A5D4I9J3_9ACTN|nr:MULTISPECIES: prephenate dehydrogenase [Streptomyces]PVC82214.1 prephenate dehydrogenase/arogenate dehydrogenase family protein [Streptomyces sp. CS014]TYR49574.1 prephenate dehydrogenase/arogenate dehydrogenase family protein [Streptomyces parvus]
MRTAAIVGTGRIGRSIGTALRARGVATYLLDIDAEAVRVAQELGAGTAQPPPRPVDIAVLAVPPEQVARVLAVQQKQGLARCYTDTAGVKVRPQRQIEASGCDLTSLVGGHPLVTDDHDGPPAARAELFEGRPWVLTPTGLTSDAALNASLELVSLCGAVPVLADHAAHDRTMALVSHTPRLIATLLASRLRHADNATLRLAGQGVRDMTRAAGGNPALWTDILTANAQPVAEVLDALAADISSAATILRRRADHASGPSEDGEVAGERPGEALARLLELGIKGRNRLPSGT